MSAVKESRAAEYMPTGPVSRIAVELAEARVELTHARARIRQLEGALRDLAAPAARAATLLEGPQ